MTGFFCSSLIKARQISTPLGFKKAQNQSQADTLLAKLELKAGFLGGQVIIALKTVTDAEVRP